MSYNVMSILPLLLALSVGVVYARHISYYDDDAALQPILSRSQERRICTELCMSGLGGDACGEDCLDLTPQGLPLQSPFTNQTQNTENVNNVAPTGASARRSVCPVLCENRLGYPLCNCDQEKTEASKVNFIKICSMFCTVYNYKLYGCQECSVYREQEEKASPGSDFRLSSLRSSKHIDYTKIDWEAWCRAKCHVGEGGIACNCDLLPMSF